MSSSHCATISHAQNTTSHLHAMRTLILRCLHFEQPFLDFLCDLRVLKTLPELAVTSMSRDLRGMRRNIINKTSLQRIECRTRFDFSFTISSRGLYLTTGSALIYSKPRILVSFCSPTSGKTQPYVFGIVFLEFILSILLRTTSV